MGRLLSAIVEKVKKLLALATSCNPHEAASAAAKAQELIEKHRISEADLNKREPQMAGDILYEFKGEPIQWVMQLVGIVAEVNGCAAFLSSLKAAPGIPRCAAALVGTGRVEDVQMVQYMAPYLVSEVSRITDETESKNKADFEKFNEAHRQSQLEGKIRPSEWTVWMSGMSLGAGHGPAWRASFEAGMVAMICNRLVSARAKARKEAAQAASDRFGLVKIEATLAEIGDRTAIARKFGQEVWNVDKGGITPKNEAVDPFAYMDGSRAGSRVALGPAEKRIQ